MNEFMTAKEMANEAEQILLPDRYEEPFIEALEVLLDSEVPRKEGRLQKVTSNGRTFRWMRGRDVPKVVEAATGANPTVKTIGLTGTEWYAEYKSSRPLLNVSRNRASDKRIGRIAVIAKNDSELSEEDLIQGNGKRPVWVVTALPNLVFDLKMNIRPVPGPLENGVSGSVEGVADTLGVAGVDLVSTGATLRQNGYRVVANIVDSYPELIWADVSEEKLQQIRYRNSLA